MTSDRWKRAYGPWAVVTGASSGIGRAIAHEIAKRGVNLVLVARRREALAELAREVTVAYGVSAKIFAADLSSGSARETLLATTKDLDVGLLVPAAGFGSSGRFVTTNLAHERSMLELNCAAVLDLVHGFARRMIKRRRGGIIVWSSITAFQGVPHSVHYAATKAWNQSFAEGLHLELKEHGIDVLASAPATVRTGFAQEAGMTMSAAATPKTVAAATIRALGRRMTVRPGFLAGFLELALKLPRALRARVMGVVMRGMAAGDATESAHHRQSSQTA